MSAPNATLDSSTLGLWTTPAALQAGATRIHHAVANLIHAAAKTCDHAAETEVPGLILGTDLRPADVLPFSRTRRWTSPFAGSWLGLHVDHGEGSIWAPPFAPANHASTKH